MSNNLLEKEIVTGCDCQRRKNVPRNTYATVRQAGRSLNDFLRIKSNYVGTSEYAKPTKYPRKYDSGTCLGCKGT